MTTSFRFFFSRIALLSLFVACALTALAEQPHAMQLTGDYWGTHDPSMIQAEKIWYVFATGMAQGGGQFQIRCSPDLVQWKRCGRVFDQIPEWIQRTSPGTKELWAPDISYENGEFRLYYAYSLFGKNTSGIALATNQTLDPSNPKYKWIDHGLVFQSLSTNDFNAIDPNFILDKKGHAWLAFGSFWDGIKMRCLDEHTGMLDTSHPQIYSLASRKRPAIVPASKPGLPPDWQAVEAPFIVHHAGYYYLFVSWDLCCRGTKSTYRTMVGRSKQISGPYVDKNAVSMEDDGGSELLVGNKRWLGPGGESVSMQHSGKDMIVFHAYDAHTGRPGLQISTITWQNGWPHAALEN